jgi:hypothetical protein
MNTYTWSVRQVDCLPTANNETNVVFRVHWNCQGTNNTDIVNTFGTTDIPFVASNTFISFSNLTEAQVIGWVQQILGTQEVLQIQSNCDVQINLLQNPTIISPALPWVK